MHLCTATMTDSSIHNTPGLSTRPLTLTVLPEELLLLIFHCLDTPTLLRCRSVCKEFSKLIISDVSLVYKIELFADGMINCEDCKYTNVERLGLLRNRRQAWKELVTVLKEWRLSTQRWNAYELVDGIFAQTMNTTEDPNSRGIMFASLPCRSFAGSVLKYEDVGFSFRDFAMDPTQDFIAYLQCTPKNMTNGQPSTVVTVFLRTMSTNKLHKNAAQETLSVTIPNFVHAAVIQIVDNVIGLVVWDNHHGSKLFIWNWVTGSLVVSQNETLRIDDFVFISNHAYAVAIPAPDSCLQVYTFDSSSEISATNRTGTCLRAALYPPRPETHVEASIFGIHTGPFTTSNSPPTCFRPSKPFTTSSESRIHVAHISLTRISASQDFQTQFYLIVVHNKTFLKFINHAERMQRPLHLAWDEWGIEGGAWIPGGTNSNWLRYVHGERLVRLHGPSGTRCLEIYDFGVPRGPPSWIPSEELPQIFQSRQLVNVLNEQVQFKLPCRVIRIPEAKPYAGFMIDEDRLVGIKDSNHDPPLFDVYTF